LYTKLYNGRDSRHTIPFIMHNPRFPNTIIKMKGFGGKNYVLNSTLPPNMSSTPKTTLGASAGSNFMTNMANVNLRAVAEENRRQKTKTRYTLEKSNTMIIFS